MTQEEKEKTIKMIDGFYTKGYLWFLLGSLISADCFIEVDKDKLKSQYEFNIEVMQDIHDCVDDSNIPKKEKAKVKKYAAQGLEALKNEMKTVVG